MSLTQDQIYAYQIISQFEDLYFNSLNSTTEPGIRTEIEPIRDAISFLRGKYKLTNSTDIEYDSYVRSIRSLHLYQDRIMKFTEDGESNN